MRQTLWLVLEAIGSILVSACLLRAWYRWISMGFRDPIGQFVFALTEWMVRPLRSVLPVRGRTDWASLFAGLCISVLLAIVYLLIWGSGRAPVFGAVVLIALAWMLKWFLWLLIAVVLVLAVLSWVNPYAPIAPILQTLAQPFLSPLQRVIPRIGNVDLSGLVLLLIAQGALSLLHGLVPAA
jgi:YggT family protein